MSKAPANHVSTSWRYVCNNCLTSRQLVSDFGDAVIKLATCSRLATGNERQISHDLQ